MGMVNPLLVPQKDRRTKGPDRRRVPVNVFAGPRLDLRSALGHLARAAALDGSVAMADLIAFAYPLYEGNPDFDDFQVSLFFAQECWKYALAGPAEKARAQEELRRQGRATEHELQALFALMDGMELRHREMFPQLHGGTA